MNITDEDREALAIFLRDLPSGVVVEGQSVPMLSGLPNWDPPVWEYIADAILASDVFARIVQERAVLNNPQIASEVAAHHADPADVVDEAMPIEYRVLVENDVVFTSGHQAIAEGYARGLKLRGEKGRLEVVAVGHA